jgi:hypothetical protein
MAESDRPLPTPPRSRFGRPLRGEEEREGSLTADRLTEAATTGRLEEFLQHEMPEGEHARNLAMMMLGMSGMAAPGTPGAASEPAAEHAVPVAAPGGEAAEPPNDAVSPVPPAVLAATTRGDVAGLMSLLRAEHARRGGDGEAADEAPGAPAVPADIEAQPAPAPAAPAPAAIDKALVDELIRVAAENQVTVDWLLLRAVKLYLGEHRKTGRL